MFDNALLQAAFSRSAQEPGMEGLDKFFGNEDEEVSLESLEAQVHAFTTGEGSLAFMSQFQEELQAVRDGMTLYSALQDVATFGKDSSAEMLLTASNAWLANVNQSIVIPEGTADDKRHEVAMEGLVDILKKLGSYISGMLKKVYDAGTKFFGNIGDAFRSQGGLAAKIKERIQKGSVKTGKVKTSSYYELTIEDKEVDISKEYMRLKAFADRVWDGADFDKMIEPVLKGKMKEEADIFKAITDAQQATLKLLGMTVNDPKVLARNAGPNNRAMRTERYLGSCFIMAVVNTAKNAMFPNGRDRVVYFASMAGYENNKKTQEGELSALPADKLVALLDLVVESAKWVDVYSDDWRRYWTRGEEVWKAAQDMAEGWTFDRASLNTILEDIDHLAYLVSDAIMFTSSQLWVANNAINKFAKESLE